MQKGVVRRKGNSWILAYSAKVTQNGKSVWVGRSKKIAPVCDQYRTPGSVKHLVAQFLNPINAKVHGAESTETIWYFVETHYLTSLNGRLAASTVNGYRGIWREVKPLVGNVRVYEFSTMKAEQVLQSFADQKPRSKSVLRGARAFLSGAMRYAVRSGAIQFNPVRETILPRNTKPKKPTVAYSLPTITAMLSVLEEPARTLVLAAALTGLRKSELRGLQWTDLENGELHVKRSVWRNIVGQTKTPESEAAIPLPPILAEALEAHRRTAFSNEWIFAGPRTLKPIDIDNFTRREILPPLKEAGIAWAGWHPFRRGLATTLRSLGVEDVVTQRILRHANVAQTRAAYIKMDDKEARQAMKKFANAYRKLYRKRVPTKPE